MKFRCLALAVALCVIPHAFAQTPAPVPADFATAQTVFISSAGSPALSSKENLTISMMYNSFYQQLAAWNKYKIAASPKDADLSFNISLEFTISQVDRGSSVSSLYIRLEARDIKTHTLLWTIDEGVNGAFREKTFEHNLDVSVAQLITDLKSLAAGQQPGATATTKP